MSSAQKSPHEKKQREYAARVTPGNRRHADARKDGKKALIREARSKSNELLADVKPQMSSADTELLLGELTAAHLRKSVSRKRPLKYEAAPLSQVIEWQSERRVESFGRKTRSHTLYDQRARESVETLNSISKKNFNQIARRAGKLCSPEYRYKFDVGLNPDDPVERALQFLRRISAGSNEENRALCRNKDVDIALLAWIKKANRVLKKDSTAEKVKVETQKVLKKELRKSAN